MKPGDIVTVYLDAARCRYPQGQATLIRKLEEYGGLEMWEVEYLDYPHKTFDVFLKQPNEPMKQDGDTTT
jgi:hypothetical protein